MLKNKQIQLVYYSLTGNIEHILKKTLYYTLAIKVASNLTMEKNFILFTPSIGFGEVPYEVNSFIKKNYSYCVGLIGSGNKNWGDNYCKAVKTLQNQYKIPILATFELSGSLQDIENINNIISNFTNI